MSEEHFVYNLSSSEDVAEFGDILRISSTEPPDWNAVEGGYAPRGAMGGNRYHKKREVITDFSFFEVPSRIELL